MRCVGCKLIVELPILMSLEHDSSAKPKKKNHNLNLHRMFTSQNEMFAMTKNTKRLEPAL